MTTALGVYTVSLTFEVRNSSVNLGMQRINLKRGHLNMRETGHLPSPLEFNFTYIH